MLTTITFAGPGSPIQFRVGVVEQPAKATYYIPVGAYSITTDVAKKIITDNHFRFDYTHANLLGTATADPKERCYGKGSCEGVMGPNGVNGAVNYRFRREAARLAIIVMVFVGYQALALYTKALQYR